LLDVVVERLIAEGRGSALANRFHIFLLTPSRQPVAVLRLARSYGSGLFEEVEGKPRLDEVVMGVLHLAETQAPRASRGDKVAKEIMKSVQDVLLRKRGGLLKPFTTSAPRSSLEASVSLLGRCRSMPDEIATAMHRWVEDRFPGLVPRDEIPFWESGGIYCTRTGLKRRDEEYRVLMEDKIPENTEAIGKAASYGDLSENFEWTAAIEQQRQLTEKAAAMEAELKVAQAIEDQERAPDIVAPGMTVTYDQDGEHQTITILGPWDEGEGVMSYNAPVAAGMLGAKAGDTVTLDVPEGAITVKVVSLELAVPIEAQEA
jgi:transcription elongation factor GreA